MMRVGSWRDDDLPALVGEALGLSVAAVSGAPTHRSAAKRRCRALDAAATRIAAGGEGVTLIAGAEANAATDNRGRGVTPPWTPAAPRANGERPAQFESRCGRRSGRASSARSTSSRSTSNALRAHEGATLADGQAESARDVGGDVAGRGRQPVRVGRASAVSEADAARRRARQPHGRVPVSEAAHREPVREPGRRRARRRRRHRASLGIPEDRWVHVIGAAGADEPADPRARSSLPPQPRARGRRRPTCRRATGTTADDYDHVELYSCFPAMPKLSVAGRSGRCARRRSPVTGGPDVLRRAGQQLS